MSNDREQEFLRFMSGHLVAFTGEYESFRPNGSLLKRGVFAFSGWVLSLHDRWCWVTAGHCLRTYLNEPIRNGALRIVHSGFADYFGPDAPFTHIYPFEYDLEAALAVDQECLGLDFALVPLPDLTRKNLEANGVVAVGRENWVHQARLTFSHYKMLGLPSAPIEASTFEMADGSMAASLQPVLIGLERLNHDEVPGAHADTWFLGRIPGDVPRIEGMSGGPIYGFRMDDHGRWYYHVVALQSRWRPKSKIVFGCSVLLFAEAVHDELAKRD